MMFSSSRIGMDGPLSPLGEGQLKKVPRLGDLEIRVRSVTQLLG